MSMENLIFRCLERFWATKYNTRYGEVTAYDPKKHAAKVKIQPGGQETGWIPIHVHHVGDGWGVLVGHQIGDQVEIGHQEGDFETAAVTKRLHSDKDKPPKVESGEILMKHEKAGQLFFDKDKNITWTGANGQVIKTDKKGNTSLSLKVSDKKDADGGSPTFTVSMTDQNDKKHVITIDKNGITHNSDVKVTIKADKIEHNGDLKVTGSILAGKVIESSQGLKGPVIGGMPGNPGSASTW